VIVHCNPSVSLAVANNAVPDIPEMQAKLLNHKAGKNICQYLNIPQPYSDLGVSTYFEYGREGGWEAAGPPPVLAGRYCTGQQPLPKLGPPNNNICVYLFHWLKTVSGHI
jgi:hypothetical protein